MLSWSLNVFSHLGVFLMASIHLYFAGKQVGDTQKRGKPEMRSSCRKSLIGVGPARARPRQVSPTSDTCQSVAILMNRPHSGKTIDHWKYQK